MFLNGSERTNYSIDYDLWKVEIFFEILLVEHRAFMEEKFVFQEKYASVYVAIYILES